MTLTGLELVLHLWCVTRIVFSTIGSTSKCQSFQLMDLKESWVACRRGAQGKYIAPGQRATCYIPTRPIRLVFLAKAVE